MELLGAIVPFVPYWLRHWLRYEVSEQQHSSLYSVSTFSIDLPASLPEHRMIVLCVHESILRTVDSTMCRAWKVDWSVRGQQSFRFLAGYHTHVRPVSRSSACKLVSEPVHGLMVKRAANRPRVRRCVALQLLTLTALLDLAISPKCIIIGPYDLIRVLFSMHL